MKWDQGLRGISRRTRLFKQKLLNAQATSLLRKVILKILICIACVSLSACAQNNEGSPAAEHTTEIVSEIDGATMVLIPGRYISDGFHNWR